MRKLLDRFRSWLVEPLVRPKMSIVVLEEKGQFKHFGQRQITTPIRNGLAIVQSGHAPLYDIDVMVGKLPCARVPVLTPGLQVPLESRDYALTSLVMAAGEHVVQHGEPQVVTDEITVLCNSYDSIRWELRYSFSYDPRMNKATTLWKTTRRVS